MMSQGETPWKDPRGLRGLSRWKTPWTMNSRN
jgi:hypothetical protein